LLDLSSTVERTLQSGSRNSYAFLPFLEHLFSLGIAEENHLEIMSPGFVADMVTDTYSNVTYITELASFKRKSCYYKEITTLFDFFSLQGFLCLFLQNVVSTDNLEHHITDIRITLFVFSFYALFLQR